MSRPRYLTSSTCGLNRLPSHWSHGTNTSARNCISTLTSPFALAGLAAAARHVEREVAGGQPARPRVLGRGEQLANRIERLQIGHRIRARRAADRRLVDEHDVGDELGAFELAVRADAAIPVALRALQRRVDHVVHERALARAADAGDAGQHAERDLDVDVLEVVLRGAENAHALVGRLAAGWPAPGSPARRAGTSPSATAAPAAAPRACPRRRRVRPARPRRAPCRRPCRRPGSCRRRARRRARCCPDRAACAGSRSAARCRASAGRSTARRARRACRPAPTRARSPG